MRKYFLLWAFMLVTICINAGDKINVSLVKQYTDTSFVLPKKAVEKKVNALKIANPKYDFTFKLIPEFEKMENDDYGNQVFSVLLFYHGNGIAINVKSEDILDNDTTSYFGDFMVGRKHFLLIDNDDNHEMLKTYFKKNSGTTIVFQRLFEKTENIVDIPPSSLNALYNERNKKMEIREYFINGEDSLNLRDKRKSATDTNKNEDNDDIFKIDVELFDE